MYWKINDSDYKKTIYNLPKQCKKKYAVFKYIAEYSGLNGLNDAPGFRLEMLKGKLFGLYSIRLNISYRVIFDVKQEIKVIAQQASTTLTCLEGLVIVTGKVDA